MQFPNLIWRRLTQFSALQSCLAAEKMTLKPTQNIPLKPAAALVMMCLFWITGQHCTVRDRILHDLGAGGHDLEGCNDRGHNNKKAILGDHCICNQHWIMDQVIYTWVSSSVATEAIKQNIDWNDGKDFTATFL